LAWLASLAIDANRYYSDLGNTVKWGSAPWPSELGRTLKRYEVSSLPQLADCIIAAVPRQLQMLWPVSMRLDALPSTMVSRSHVRTCRVTADPSQSPRHGKRVTASPAGAGRLTRPLDHA
jgi:hypothetical protein